MELKRIGVLSAAKISAILMALLGLIVSIIILLVGVALAPIAGSWGLAGFGIAAIIIVPIMYAIIGFISGVIMAFVYNLVAGWIGGIKIELAR